MSGSAWRTLQVSKFIVADRETRPVHKRINWRTSWYLHDDVKKGECSDILINYNFRNVIAIIRPFECSREEEYVYFMATVRDVHVYMKWK